jgi:diguanylate cyclase (GGDEF)-like protein
MAASALEALGLLVRPDAGVTHVLNRSKDRAVPEATTGDAVADVLALDALSLCVGVVRGSMYVTDDASLPLSVRCPVYPASSGTLACVPMSSGEAIGAVHLYWRRPNALSLEVRSSVVRIIEHAALAIGNRRLLAALHGQANTDARTGLSNSRAFDLVLESELAAMANTDSLAVLMLDIDHFKDFNDRHGHPAGDEVLRTFAGILRSCVRDGDLAARYGGEEFVVLLPGADETSARAVAERIRARTEQTIVPLGPGLTDRISVSIGIAMAPAHGLDRVTILRIADEALYRAKDAGRNRVEFDGGDGLTPLLPAAVA